MCNNVSVPFDVLSLSQWADRQGLSKYRAYRLFHAAAREDEATGRVTAELTDKAGHTVYAERTGSGVIRVYLNGQPDPLAHVDIHALAARLRDAGYVMLSPDQAARLAHLLDEVVPARPSARDESQSDPMRPHSHA